MGNILLRDRQGGKEPRDKRVNTDLNTDLETDAILGTLHILPSLISTTALGGLIREVGACLEKASWNFGQRELK